MRAPTSCCQIVFELVGPVNSTPSVRPTMFATEVRSSRPANATSAPSEPRLWPNTTSFGRSCSGSCDHRCDTALNSSAPASWATSESTSVEIQLGRNEYWIAIIAVSPP